MAQCPNCGRDTKRTTDWCCQWCGYPLLSGSYKKLDKSYKELKEERLPVQPEPEPESEPESEPEPEPEPEKQPEPSSAIGLDDIQEGMTITVDDIDALFRADKTGANTRLADKTLLVKGNVSKIFIRDHIDVRYVLLTGSSKKMLWSVRCVFGPSELSQMSRLSEGETVTMRGKYDGYSKNIILKDCVLA